MSLVNTFNNATRAGWTWNQAKRAVQEFKAMHAERRKLNQQIREHEKRNYYRKPKQRLTGRPKRRKYTPAGGNYAGRFRKPRKFKKITRGVSAQIEAGGEANASAGQNCVWVGFTPFTAANTGRLMIVAILRRLAAMNKTPFRSENEGVFTEPTLADVRVEVNWQYSVNDEPDITTGFYEYLTGATGVNTTWKGIADGVWNALQTQFTTTTMRKTKWRAFELNFNKTTAPAIQTNTNRLDMVNLLLDYRQTSVVNLQNRTAAQDNTGNFADDINANPVSGYMYMLKSSSPEIASYNVPSTTISTTFSTDQTSGVVIIPSTNVDYDDSITNALSRPNKNVWAKTSKITPISLQPGHVKKASVSKGGTMYFDTYWNMFVLNYAHLSSRRGDFTDRGKMIMFGFEKRVLTGSGTADISIGYEHDQYHYFHVRRPKPPAYIRTFQKVI